MLTIVTPWTPDPTEHEEPLGIVHQPWPGEVQCNPHRGEIVFAATVQYPRRKACIDRWGQRYQAFLGTRLCGGKPAKYTKHFVFLSDADIDEIYAGLLKLDLQPLVHFSVSEAKKLAGHEYLQGDPVAISLFWSEDGQWVERPYEAFVQEKVEEDGEEVIKPWTPQWVFHGSGAIHEARTGCIACPCDCPGGIIADNRQPIYRPMPTVFFDMSKAPRAGTTVYVRIRAADHVASE